MNKLICMGLVATIDLTTSAQSTVKCFSIQSMKEVSSEVLVATGDASSYMLASGEGRWFGRHLQFAPNPVTRVLGDKLYVLDGRKIRIEGRFGTESPIEVPEGLQSFEINRTREHLAALDKDGNLHNRVNKRWVRVRLSGKIHSYGWQVSTLVAVGPNGLFEVNGLQARLVDDTQSGHVIVGERVYVSYSGSNATIFKDGRRLRTQSPDRFRITSVAIVGSLVVVSTSAGRTYEVDERGWVLRLSTWIGVTGSVSSMHVVMLAAGNGEIVAIGVPDLKPLLVAGFRTVGDPTSLSLSPDGRSFSVGIDSAGRWFLLRGVAFGSIRECESSTGSEAFRQEIGG
jgi:hypothetical protein